MVDKCWFSRIFSKMSLFYSLGSSSAEGTSASLSLPLIETFGELETEESFLEALTNSGGTPGSKKSGEKIL